jgi:hypothetical protein
MRKLNARAQQQKNQFLGAELNPNSNGEIPIQLPYFANPMKFA